MGEPKKNDSLILKEAACERQMHLEAREKGIASVSNRLRLFFKEVQVAETRNKVTVHKIPKGEDVQMAFSFIYREKTYFLAVEGNTIKLEPNQTIPNNNCLLQWGRKVGDWGTLKSVAKPEMFLIIQDDTVTVSSTEPAEQCLFRLT